MPNDGNSSAIVSEKYAENTENERTIVSEIKYTVIRFHFLFELISAKLTAISINADSWNRTAIIPQNKAPIFFFFNIYHMETVPNAIAIPCLRRWNPYIK